MTVGQLPVLTLDPDLDPWDRHEPRETTRRYSQFRTYLDAGRGRTLRKVAETLALHPAYVRAVAAAYRWVERAEAWDRHRDQMHEKVWLEERRRAAENDSKILGAAVGKIADRLRSLRADDLTNSDLIRLLDVVLRQRRALFGDPQTIALTGLDGSPLTVQLAEFAGMSIDQRRQTISGLAADVQRRIAAARGEEDDDPGPD